MRKQALSIRKDTFGLDHHSTARSLANLGNAMFKAGKKAEGIAKLQQGVDIFKMKLGPNHPDTLGFGGMLQRYKH